MDRQEQFRQEMLSYRLAVIAEANVNKETNFVWNALGDLYARFDEVERSMANKVLSEWLASDNENLRSDALSVIGRHCIASLIPALRELAERVSLLNSPGAPYELDWIKRVIGKLEDRRLHAN